MGREPDTLADLMGGRSLALLVCSSRIAVGRLLKGRASPGVLEEADYSLNVRAGHLLLLEGRGG